MVRGVVGALVCVGIPLFIDWITSLTRGDEDNRMKCPTLSMVLSAQPQERKAIFAADPDVPVRFRCNIEQQTMIGSSEAIKCGDFGEEDNVPCIVNKVMLPTVSEMMQIQDRELRFKTFDATHSDHVDHLCGYTCELHTQGACAYNLCMNWGDNQAARRDDRVHWAYWQAALKFKRNEDVCPSDDDIKLTPGVDQFKWAIWDQPGSECHVPCDDGKSPCSVRKIDTPQLVRPKVYRCPSRKTVLKAFEHIEDKNEKAKRAVEAWGQRCNVNSLVQCAVDWSGFEDTEYDCKGNNPNGKINSRGGRQRDQLFCVKTATSNFNTYTVTYTNELCVIPEMIASPAAKEMIVQKPPGTAS